MTKQEKTKIQEKRMQLGLTVKEFAELIGVSLRAIYYYENGREPNVAILKKMAAVLGCHMEDLIEKKKKELYLNTVFLSQFFSHTLQLSLRLNVRTTRK